MAEGAVLVMKLKGRRAAATVYVRRSSGERSAVEARCPQMRYEASAASRDVAVRSWTGEQRRTTRHR
jgi:hypothetical protein